MARTLKVSAWSFGQFAQHMSRTQTQPWSLLLPLAGVSNHSPYASGISTVETIRSWDHTWLPNILSVAWLCNTIVHSWRLVAFVNTTRPTDNCCVSLMDIKLHLQQVIVACIWRVSVNDQSYIKWLTTQSSTDTFYSLSLTSRRLLVTSWSRHLNHYDTTNRQLLRVVDLP